MRLNSLALETKLTGGMALRKRKANIAYLTELNDENLLFNYRQEAGLMELKELPKIFHRGWELPTCQLRGHFTGHWLSAAARLYKITGDTRLKARLEYLINEIAKCQRENGGEWCFTIPEKYLYRIRDNKPVWAPHYTVHKVLMGLNDAAEFAGIGQALDIAESAAKWFMRYTDGISRGQMDELMERTETGGMMEAWADLYRMTKNPDHLELMRRYERPRYYEKLLAGKDILTNKHANTTIPEILGVCKAYEITNDERYMKIAKAYWDLAVERRGSFATGGQSSGEIWTPLQKQASRLGNKNQEHCTVYNMMRLAEFLLRWTGETRFADYWERNLYNGLFAQGYYEPHCYVDQSEHIPEKSEIIAYFLPLIPGARKRWGSKLDHFWCCHGTLLQANSLTLQEAIYYTASKELSICQFLESEVTIAAKAIGLSSDVSARQWTEIRSESRPDSLTIVIEIDGRDQNFKLRIRRPWWAAGQIRIEDVNGNEIAYDIDGGYMTIESVWEKTKLSVIVPKTIKAVPLDDRPDTVAFLDGPVMLAGLIDKEVELIGTADNPRAMFIAIDERQWDIWNADWQTIGQRENIRFTPIYNIGRQTYTTYFPLRRP